MVWLYDGKAVSSNFYLKYQVKQNNKMVFASSIHQKPRFYGRNVVP